MDACRLVRKQFDTRLPLLFKSDPSTIYNHIYPSRGPKAVAGCTSAYREYCKHVFELPAQALAQVLHKPDPNNLPITADCISGTLNGPFKGNKSSGLSLLPSPLVNYLHVRNL